MLLSLGLTPRGSRINNGGCRGIYNLHGHVVKITTTTIRLVLSLVVSHDWNLHQLDVHITFFVSFWRKLLDLWIHPSRIITLLDLWIHPSRIITLLQPAIGTYTTCNRGH
jgi:hypothetical protein